MKTRQSYHLPKKAFINKSKAELRLEKQQKEFASNSTTVLKEEIELLKIELAEKERIIGNHQIDLEILNNL